jgi:hypothetical protein
VIRAFLVAAAFAFLLAGCGGNGDTKAEPGGDASLRVKHVVAGPPYYTEGSIWHVRVVDSNGSEVLDEKLSDNGVSVQLGAGRYRLESEELPCDGNCSNLDPPADACSKELVVEAGQQLAATVKVKPSHGCSISVLKSSVKPRFGT